MDSDHSMSASQKLDDGSAAFSPGFLLEWFPDSRA